MESPAALEKLQAKYDCVLVVTQMIIRTQAAAFMIMEKMDSILNSLSIAPTLKAKQALTSVYDEFKNDKDSLMHRIKVLQDVRDELNTMSKVTTDGTSANKV